MPELKRYRRIHPDEFVESAKTLVELGWHPLPLGGEKGKKPLVSGHHGHEGVDVTDEDTFREWADLWAANEHGLNLAVRMPVGVIGIDVDCYDGKQGAATLAEHERLWGPLPGTWSVTARSDGSRKLFFRVPAGWTGRGVLGPGVETLQRHLRYSVAPPSVHDSGLVRARTPDGRDGGQLPPPAELPMLPEAWLDGLAHDAGLLTKGSPDAAKSLLASFRPGEISPAVQSQVKKVRSAIRSGAGRYDAMRDAVMSMVRLGSTGARGVRDGLAVVEAEYVRAVSSSREGEDVARDECRRALDGALGAVVGEPNYRLMDFYTGDVFNADGSVRAGSWLGKLVSPLGVVPGNGSDSPRVRFTAISAAVLARPVPPMEWLIHGVWPANSFGPVGGEKKTLKSYNLMAIALAVSSGLPLFGEFQVESAGPVLYYAAEGGQAPFQRRLQSIAAGYEIDSLGDLPLHAVFDVGGLDEDEFTDALRRHLDVLQPSLVILDPLYAFHPAGIEAGNLYDRGRMLAQFTNELHGQAALMIADHFKKTGGSALDLDSISQTGMGQWADSWVLQRHRRPPDLDAGTYNLAVEFGSRQWGGGRWDLNWHLPTIAALEAGASSPVSWSIERYDLTGEEGRAADSIDHRILSTLRARPGTLTESQLAKAVGGNKTTAKSAIDRLRADGLITAKSAKRREGTRDVTREVLSAARLTFAVDKDDA
ncbi:AAA family ATPase [Williamsia phyllosphaerae]|uniref:AAA family ATPase n=1 Tax=Williamsia phyllosphaerae TaxID=885042 RepID=UPI00166A289E|nr:AAA family ATPase [Williamsia phyllosphaerae]